ncbi:MAG: signal peptide peptidase SppA [Verrucomicrobiales bacterium]|jgi:protease-4|nr:signal peptide peptidase SppA [Verrucomicrobiales bacterium]
MKKVILIILGIGVLGTLGVSLLVNFCLIVSAGDRASSAGRTFHEVHHSGKHKGPKVAIIDLNGIISHGAPGAGGLNMVDEFLAKLEQAADDDATRAVLIRINSPGGEVTASDVIYHALKKTDQKKPVVSYIQTVGASGAYYSAVGTRYLMANELSLTASIGVIMQSLNVQELTDKIGVHSLTFKSGKMKDMLNPFRPATDEEKAYVQELINETYDKFVGIVARERKLDETALREGVADGRVVSGKTAVNANLIDATGYFEDAVAKTKTLANLPANAQVVELQAPFNLAQLFRIFGNTSLEKIELNIGPQGARLEAGKLYYLSEMSLAH